MKAAPQTRTKAKPTKKPAPRESAVRAQKGAGAGALAKTKKSKRRTRPAPALGTTEIHELRTTEVAALRAEVTKKRAELSRWNPDPEDVQKSVAQLVLSLVDFVRKLLERQAIRRMEGETLDPEEVERVGLALMRLEETVHDLAARFGLSPEELNLDLGPLGRLS